MRQEKHLKSIRQQIDVFERTGGGTALKAVASGFYSKAGNTFPYASILTDLVPADPKHGTDLLISVFVSEHSTPDFAIVDDDYRAHLKQQLMEVA